MFRITRDPSSGSIVLCLVKNYKNGSIVSVESVSVLWQHMLSLHRPRPWMYRITVCRCNGTCCHYTDLVRVNGYDRTITVILAKHSTRLPDEGSSVIRNMLEHF